MEEEKFNQAAKIKQEMNNLKMIQDRLYLIKLNSVISFGVGIKDGSHFCPIIDEELNSKLLEITKEHCERKMDELEKKFSEV